jgi:thiosulfate reductase cytochrome b subunit
MQKVYVHPLPVRIWHWVNALGFVLLIATGLQIRYLDMFYVLSFENAVVSHNWIGFALIANYFLWFCFYLFTDKISNYIPETDPKKYFLGAARQIYFYAFGIFRGDPNPYRVTPERKFNALQIMMYQLIMLLLVPLLFGSGILLWDVERFSTIIELLGGVRIVDTLHVLLFIFFASFIVTHVYLVTLGHTTMAHIKAMFSGFEEVDDEPPKKGPAA